MPKASPPVRAALAVLALVTAAGVGATAFLLGDRWEAAEDATRRELVVAASAVATTLDVGGSEAGVAMRLRRAASAAGVGLAVLDARGRLAAASDPAFRVLNPAIVSGTSAPETVLWQGEEHYVAFAEAGDHRVLALRPASDVMDVYARLAQRTFLLAVLVGLVSLLGMGGLVWVAGRQTTARLRMHAERLAALDPIQDVAPLLSRAAADLGTYADAFHAFPAALRAAHGRAVEARSHVAALLQINPHYVLLCTLDGHVVDANPAFYAMSGLPAEAVRGNRVEVLNEVMPVEPLFELARRSLRENASIGGVEYALLNRDDVRRPVQVSLRAVAVEGKKAVMIQATDVANQRNLERQIATFSDALDLMVDQRVAQLTAGNASLGLLLDAAGVVVVSFDEGEGTRRWSRAAEELTGRGAPHVPHFSAFMSALGLSADAREAFSGWFWGPSEGAHAVEVSAADGPPRRLLWRKALTAEDGRAERRLLVGVELGRAPAPTGDGMKGAPSALWAGASV